ncbi:tetratricopeptide repeat protein [Fulvivirgaceae bacterium PWU4]|uniref:Tetratricopeptide repeat protein n=1 Tax=Chryseosolibacter histidini TaxID=2782349 RepID=A0AAP2DJ94_9BACT|nr:tetratricopeptide repeat protein [Chryseosolibacter histidini]MBT1696418.1 tetratricopeptide repeat protein [Chryseosolibacter histidini]
MMSLCRPLLLPLLLLAQFAGQAGDFDTLSTVAPEKRVALARIIYKKEFRRVDSVRAFQAFETLFKLAQKLKDRQLECSIPDLQADYFSVNRGFNKLSPVYHQQAIDLAIRYDLPMETALYTLKKGLFYNTFKHYVEAYRYILEAYDLFKAVGFEHVPEITTHLHTMANFYYHIEDFENTRLLLSEAIQYKASSPTEEANMTNTLALTYQKLGDDQGALTYFNRALAVARAAGDSAWIGILSGNIGAIHYRRGEYDKAIKDLALDCKLSLRYDQWRSAAAAMLTMIQCHLSMGNMAKADSLLRLSVPLLERVDELELWISYYDTMALLSEKRGQVDVALTYRKQYNAAKDSLQVVNDLAAVNRFKLKWEMDRHKAEVDKLKTEATMEVYKRNSLIAMLLLLMVISVLTYNRQVLKRKKERELFEKQEALLQSEKARTMEELQHATQMLDRYTENLRQKNALIEEFKTEIENLQLQHAGPDEERIGVLQKLMSANIMTDETWDEFKKLFDKVHAGFLVRLRERFIQVTETDIRLLTLLKLGLNNREMSNMLGVTTEAIKKSRQRLRKKINLPEGESLEEVVATI